MPLWIGKEVASLPRKEPMKRWWKRLLAARRVMNMLRDNPGRKFVFHEVLCEPPPLCYICCQPIGETHPLLAHPECVARVASDFYNDRRRS